MNKQLYKSRHELWLHTLFASFAINDQELKSRLYEFSQIHFRHMKWVGNETLACENDYNYDRSMKLLKRNSVFEVLEALRAEIINSHAIFDSSVLCERMRTDDSFMIYTLENLLSHAKNDAPVTAFNTARKWGELDGAQIDALTMFLFEESYKEYELILIYAYMQTRTDDALRYNIFQDLIDESHFHLKSFGNMMARLGILALPRELHEMTYKIKDLKKFVVDGIAEEEAAKEMCRNLSAAIKDEELSKFFDFINYQESYHIELMKKLL